MAKKRETGQGKVKVGIVGCGNISGIYLENMSKVLEAIEVAACSDIIPERSKAKSQEFKGVRAATNEEIFADPEIRIVVNLTPPVVHYEVAQAAIDAGKSVHNEKPLSVTREQGKRLLSTAKAKGVRVGCAPDTFMGAGLQTCRKLIDDGWIGEPIGAVAFMAGRGPEGWHPSPEFFYKPGGGPMFDMGPYYLTTLVTLMGPVKRVTGSAHITFAERLITSQPLYGKKIKVETPTHIAGVMDFASGAVGTILTSFDVWKATLPRIEIFGTEGSLSVPDPNTFGGPVKVCRPGADWAEVPLTHIYSENSRGIGVADMASGLLSGRPHRTNGELAYHVLDLMHAFHDASREGRHVNVESTCQRPAPLPLGLRKGQLDK